MANEGKYVIHATIKADGTVARKDVVGAIFGQTEGLLGEDLQLRKLQRTGRIGHVDVNLNNNKGRVKGEIIMTSSIDQVSTAVIGAALETIDRIGPCKAIIRVQRIENVNSAKRDTVIDRAKTLLMGMIESGADESKNILDDVRNLLKFGIKNAIATMGSGIKPELIELAGKKKSVTAFLDGDRGGRLLLMEISGSLGKSLTHVAMAPQSREVEHLEGKVVTKCLNQKEAANKAVSRITAELAKEDDASVGRGSAALEAPDEVKSWADKMDGLKTNNAIIILEDGSATEPVGARKLEEALAEAEGAQGLVFAGKVNDRIFDLASGAGIGNVLGKTVGKDTLKGGVQAFSVKDL